MAEKKIGAWQKGYIEGFNDASKAFGNCENCYGKGYATYRVGITQHADFYGDKTISFPMKMTMRFCRCDRGTQLKRLIDK